MDAHTHRHYFHEEQRFPWWIKAIPLLTVVGLVVVVVALGTVGQVLGALIVGVLLTVVFLPLAVLHCVMTLVTTVDAAGLHLRVRPARFRLLPRRMMVRDVPPAEIARCEVGTYNALTGREFWGWHVWGLAAAPGEHYLYVMRPDGPVRTRGVWVELAGGGKLLVGSSDPGQLAAAIARARGGAR